MAIYFIRFVKNAFFCFVYIDFACANCAYSRLRAKSLLCSCGLVPRGLDSKKSKPLAITEAESLLTVTE
ncbi:hypothetical protein [Helicobacter sp. T3_23-1059]